MSTQTGAGLHTTKPVEADCRLYFFGASTLIARARV